MQTISPSHCTFKTELNNTNMANSFTQLKEYITNQGNHHKKRKFKEEYIALLEAFEIDFDETYLFDWLD